MKNLKNNLKSKKFKYSFKSKNKFNNRQKSLHKKMRMMIMKTLVNLSIKMRPRLKERRIISNRNMKKKILLEFMKLNS
jgi:hypothetical protein